jgi:hypothetical protein
MNRAERESVRAPPDHERNGDPAASENENEGGRAIHSERKKRITKLW